jgi:hypothetical protein
MHVAPGVFRGATSADRIGLAAADMRSLRAAARAPDAGDRHPDRRESAGAAAAEHERGS